MTFDLYFKISFTIFVLGGIMCAIGMLYAMVFRWPT